jgi:hypothetical protein
VVAEDAQRIQRLHFKSQRIRARKKRGALLGGESRRQPEALDHSLVNKILDDFGTRLPLFNNKADVGLIGSGEVVPRNRFDSAADFGPKCETNASKHC